MAETVKEKTICSSCGVEVRDGAVFCYNCGEPIAPLKKSESYSSGKSNAQNGHVEDLSPKMAEVKMGPGSAAASGAETRGRSDLRSAASMRKNVKAYNRKPVEIVWAAPERPPASYIIGSVLLIALTALMLFLFWFLK